MALVMETRGRKGAGRRSLGHQLLTVDCGWALWAQRGVQTLTTLRIRAARSMPPSLHAVVQASRAHHGRRMALLHARSV